MSWDLRKKRGHFLSEGISFLTFVFYLNVYIDMYSMCRIHFQNVHTLTCQKKHYFIEFCYLFLKSWNAFRVSLKRNRALKSHPNVN